MKTNLKTYVKPTIRIVDEKRDKMPSSAISIYDVAINDSTAGAEDLHLLDRVNYSWRKNNILN